MSYDPLLGQMIEAEGSMFRAERDMDQIRGRKNTGLSRAEVLRRAQRLNAARARLRAAEALQRAADELWEVAKEYRTGASHVRGKKVTIRRTQHKVLQKCVSTVWLGQLPIGLIAFWDYQWTGIELRSKKFRKFNSKKEAKDWFLKKWS